MSDLAQMLKVLSDEEKYLIRMAIGVCVTNNSIASRVGEFSSTTRLQAQTRAETLRSGLAKLQALDIL